MTFKSPKPTHLLASVGLTSALLFTPGYAVSSPNHHHDHVASQMEEASLHQSEQAATFTQDLISQQRIWTQSQGADKSKARENLIAKAQVRRNVLAELIQTSPEEALRFAIPQEKQLGMPQEVQDMLEHRLEVEGELDVFYEDYDDGSHKVRRFVKTVSGERFELHPAGKTHEMQSGEKVRVKGLLLAAGDEASVSDGDIAIPEGGENILMLAADGTTSGGSNGGTPEPVANTFGEQRVAVFLVNFADNPSDKPWTKDDVMNVIAGEVNNFVKENSFQQTWLTVDVYGWYTAPHDSSVCDTKSIGDTGRQGATAEGADLSTYDRIISIHPPTSACKWSGVGSVGGTPSTAVINGSLTHGTVSHELGHNFGLYHSHALYCNGESLGTNCGHIEYGNIPDIMGQMVAGHFNAYQKERLGWLGFGSSPAITTVDTAGTYTIDSYASQTNGVKALKFLKGIDPVTGQENWYYVEHRGATGYDTDLGKYSNYPQGVMVHFASHADGDSSYQLDMNPQTTDLWDGALEAGQLFYDSDSNTTISTEFVDGNGATVYVDAGANQVCSQANPTVTLNPSDTVWAAAGTSITYNFTVYNNDTSACPSSTYDIGGAFPSGWATSFADTSLNISPGSSMTTTVVLTPPVTAKETFYGISFSATNGFYGTQANTMVVIDNSTTTTNNVPVAENDSASTGENSAVSIHVLANDRDADGDALTVTSTSGVYGSAVINSDGTITFTPATGFSGTETFTYYVSDGKGGSASAAVSVTVAASNTAPLAYNDSASTSENTAVTINVLANDSDADGDTLTVTSTSGVYGSALINSDGTITFAPATGFSGTETFNYTVSDGKGGSDSATVSVDVIASNTAPLAYNDSASTSENTAVTINVLANDSDADGDTLTVTSTSGVYGSAVINSNGAITFTPANGFSGTETFTYYVSDGKGGSASATVTVSVSASNTAPLAYNDSASTNENTPVTINVLANDSDADGDILTVTLTSGVNGSAVINNDGTITFTPASGFSGIETFTYYVSDGKGGSASATVTVTVAATNTNSAPVAVNDAVSMSSVAAITVPVMNNDWDPENDSLSVSAVTQGAKGSVRINSDGTLTYTPARSFKNSDSFTYTIFDGNKYDTATVTLQLSGTSGTGGKGNGKNK